MSFNSTPVSLTAAQSSCTDTLFPGKACGVLDGSLSLYVSNGANAAASTFVAPDFDAALAALGMGNLATIAFELEVVVDHAPSPIPKDIAPVFLNTLTDVVFLAVIETSDYTNSPDVAPSISRLVALPGLSSLERMVSPSIFLPPALYVGGTALGDMRSFSSLACPPQLMMITQNRQLTSLEGLNRLATWTNGENIGGLGYVISANDLTGPLSIAALSVLAGCPNPALSPAGDGLQIQVTGCTITVSSCAFSDGSWEPDSGMQSGVVFRTSFPCSSPTAFHAHCHGVKQGYVFLCLDKGRLFRQALGSRFLGCNRM